MIISIQPIFSLRIIVLIYYYLYYQLFSLQFACMCNHCNVDIASRACIAKCVPFTINGDTKLHAETLSSMFQ